MKVLCINNAANRAPGDEPTKGSHPDYVHEDLDVGRTYDVYAMMIFNDRLRYLIGTGERGWDPKWVSPVFFDVVDDRLPFDWRFLAFAESPWEAWERRWPQAMWGYSYLIDNFPDHDGRMIDRDPVELALFREEVLRRSAGEPPSTHG